MPPLEPYISLSYHLSISFIGLCSTMTTYQSLLRDTASFNQGVNLTQKIFKSRKRIMLDMLPIIYRKPRQLDPSHQVLVKSVVPEKSQASCSPKPSNSRSSVTVNPSPKRKILHRSRRPMRLHRSSSLSDQTLAGTERSYSTLLSPVGAAGIKENQGNIHPTENPFSSAIQAA